jgi:uncharacterized membrane protein
MSQAPMYEVSQDDKLWAMLAYIPFIWPIPAVISLIMEDKKNRPYIKFNAVQSIAVGIVIYLLTAVTVGCGSILFIAMFYWAYVAYQGQDVRIPFISDFIRNQGWA